MPAEVLFAVRPEVGTMTDPNEQVLDEARQYGETLTTRDFLLIVERDHPGAGVDEETLVAYDEAIATDDILPFAEGQLRSAVDEDLSTNEGWQDAETYYDVGDGRVSLFPKRWHDRLADSADLREYIAIIEEASAEEDTASDLPKGGIGTGVPESLLLDVMIAIDGIEREAAKERLESDRRDGKLVQDADQHPDARIYLPEEAEEMRDDWLDY